MKKLFLLLFILAVPFFTMAQNNGPYAVLEYYEDDTALEITDASGTPITDIYYGMELQDGDTIRTKGTVAELRLDPNGSIIKLAQDTVFTIENLQKTDSDSNDFKLAAGKIHAIAARAGFAHYRIITQSAVAGVRGTDFGVISIPGSKEEAFVLNGLIDYTKLSTNQTISVGSGMVADALSDVFKAAAASQEQLKNLVKDVVFTKLDPSKVPGHEPKAEKKQPETKTDNGAADNKKAEESKKPTKQEIARQAKNNTMSAITKFLKLEIGTVSINEKTWSKAVIQPTFNLGKLKLSLYLPVIYATDLFDPNDWYKPEGNNEWSFGTDQNTWPDRAQDFFSDLFLKIRYVEWGKQRDPFFFKIGNLNDMTLGHGLIMQNFANDADFPSIRRVGLNLGIDSGKVGFEAVVNDLADPEIFGGRFYVRPFWKLALGVSSVMDIDPASAADPAAGVPADTKVISGGLDADLPIFENDVLSFILFSDIAGMVPYQNGSFQTDALYDKDTKTFRNYGWKAGVFGNILFIKYNLEYRYFDGIFKPNLFNTDYERMRGIYIDQIDRYLQDPTASPLYNKKTMGIYGEAGFGIKDMFNVKLGYMWPWSEDSSFKDLDDELLLKLEILPDTIPVVGLYGSVSYQRTGFIQTIMNNGSADLFDANTVVTGELIYPVSPMINLAAVFTTSVLTNSDGTIKYKDDGSPDIVPSITIETRLGY